MLEKADLSKSLSKKDYKTQLPQLQQRLYDVQKTCRGRGTAQGLGLELMCDLLNVRR